MRAAYILLAFGLLFLGAAVLKIVRHRAVTIQVRTWLLIAIIFLAVGAWIL